jgi:hypothetical protein
MTTTMATEDGSLNLGTIGNELPILWDEGSSMFVQNSNEKRNFLLYRFSSRYLFLPISSDGDP